MSEDEDQLKLLSIFQYIYGGLSGLFACLPLIYIGMGVFVLLIPEGANRRGDPPQFVGWLLIIAGSVAMAIGWAIAGCILASGRYLAQRKHRMFCLVMACIECVFVPIGTALGVFTIIVLSRDSVKQIFDSNDVAPLAPEPSDF